MKKFRYRVIDHENRLQTGILDSADLNEARQTIRNNDWQIIEVKEYIDIKEKWNSVFFSSLKYSALSSFCYNMAVIVESGVNLVKGIHTLLLQTKDKKMRKLLNSLLLELERGNPLSEAMRQNEQLFPPLLIPMVASGELSGNLEEILYNMAEYYERENTVREKIKSASVYPVILGIVGITLVIFFINFILPALNDLISQSGSQAKLPVLTQAVLKSANFLQDYILLILPAGGLVLGGLLYYSRIQPLKTWLHRFALRLPILGIHSRKVITARFTGTLYLYLKTGIPLSSGLRSLEEVVSNEVVKELLRDASERVMRGESLTDALAQGDFFDGLVIEMMRVGEEAGTLEEMLQKLSKQYDKKVVQSIDKMVSLIEPVFTLLIGGAVAILVIAIALPMLNLSNLVNGG